MIPSVLKAPLRPIVRWWRFNQLPAAARSSKFTDARGLPAEDPGITESIEAALDWLCVAQDHSASADGGVARHYSLVSGWAPSYPETTGYIIPTLIAEGISRSRPELVDRARRMLDWLVSIQFPEGGFQGGMVTQLPRVPVTFNTGQILLGLAAGVHHFGEQYRPAMERAADFLAGTLDDDGCWRSHRTPFAKADDKSYETHVSWGLFEAARVGPDRGWSAAGLKQVRWALTHMRTNGWMGNCCLLDPSRPLTHTLGYALRGILEAWRFSRDTQYLEAAERLGAGLLSAMERDGRHPVA